MSNNIEWKKSSIDYDKLNQLTHCKLVQIEIGKNQGKINSKNGNLIKAGKAAAKINLKNGQLDSIRSYESCSKGGKISGKNNVKSGHLKSICRYGGLAAAKINKDNGNFDKMRNSAYDVTRKPIIGINKKTNKKIEFISIAEAARFVNGAGGNINKVLAGKIKSAYGYIWKYKDII